MTLYGLKFWSEQGLSFLESLGQLISVFVLSFCGNCFAHVCLLDVLEYHVYKMSNNDMNFLLVVEDWVNLIYPSWACGHWIAISFSSWSGCSLVNMQTVHTSVSFSSPCWQFYASWFFSKRKWSNEFTSELFNRTKKTYQSTMIFPVSTKFVANNVQGNDANKLSISQCGVLLLKMRQLSGLKARSSLQALLLSLRPNLGSVLFKSKFKPYFVFKYWTRLTTCLFFYLFFICWRIMSKLWMSGSEPYVRPHITEPPCLI